jgi:DNA-binding CsgD family transcriptional regulator
VLTARESQVLRLYLKGHSTGSIAERLDISKHTVALHRKNAYAKLDIGSQFELFHLFIDSLTCFDADEPGDPLRTYLSAPP